MTKDKSLIQSCIDHINTAVDVDPWAKELVAEMGKEVLKYAKDINVPNNDCISRQAAIDTAIEAVDSWDGGCNIGRQKRIHNAITQLPSVQPVDKDINVSCKDCISRQVAIDALEKVADLFPWRVPGKRDTYDSYNEAWNDAIGRAEMEIEKLPSVKPTYTNAEIQKIQDMEQAEIEKAFELGREDAMSEIIHCKDCKHKGTKNCLANAWTTIFGVTVKDDFYCGLAERRTDD